MHLKITYKLSINSQNLLGELVVGWVISIISDIYDL